MDLSKYRCLNCGKNLWAAYTTFWKCENCGQQYSCVSGIPRLYLENHIGQEDKALRDYFYNGFLGSYYQYVMPFLSLPARPLKMSWKDWIAYALIVDVLILVIVQLINLLFVRRLGGFGIIDAVFLCFVGLVGYFLIKHRYLLNLLILAIPVRLSLNSTKFKPDESFADVHSRSIERLRQKNQKLRVLDVSTGTCNSLYRHGWMELNADYVGLDLSEKMLLQGLNFMTEKQVPMEFVLGDAAELPFEPETFDVVLNYGAINGMADPQKALAEMARVCKKDGLVFFLDEQLYDSASFVERKYFESVLSSHNVVHHCPVELLPDNLENVQVKQVYHFYYICTAIKK
jgi:ubiquinone/menaquinone biosynthesis C-methylase UbiE